MFTQITPQGVYVAFSYFAQHPAYGLVDERVGMGEESCGDAQRVGILTLAYQGECGNYGYALLPQVAGRPGACCRRASA